MLTRPNIGSQGGCMEIFDIHHHLGSLSGGSLQEGDDWQGGGYVNRVRIMEANGVTGSAILAATGYIQADGIKDTMRCNDTVAAYRKCDPKRFPVACGIVEPLHGMRPSGELGLVPLIHTNAESNLEAVWRLERLALEFPALTFVSMDALTTNTNSQL